MENAQQRSSGCVPSVVFPLFCGDGEWAPPPPSHVQDVKENTGEKDHPMDAEPFGLDDAGEVLAHDLRTISRAGLLLG